MKTRHSRWLRLLLPFGGARESSQRRRQHAILCAPFSPEVAALRAGDVSRIAFWDPHTRESVEETRMEPSIPSAPAAI